MSNGLRNLFASFIVHVDTKEVEHAHDVLNEAKHEAEGLGEQFEKLKQGVEKFLVAYGIERIAEGTEQIVKQANALGNTAAAAGVSTDSLQQWQEVAGLVGGSADSVATIFKILSKNAYEASQGTGTAGKAFKELGVDVKDTHGALKPIDQILEEVGGKLAEMPDATKRSAIGTEVLGRGVLELLPAFSNGKEGLEEFLATVRESGPAFSEAFIKESKEAVKVSAEFEKSTKKLKVTLAGILLPVLDAFQKKATELADALTKLLSNGEKVSTMLEATAAVAVPYLIGALGGLTAILETVGTAALEAFLPFFVLAAIGLLVEDLIVFLKGGDSALGAFLDSIFGAGSAQVILQGIRDAFKEISDWLEAHGPELKEFWEDVKTVGGESLKGIYYFIVDTINALGDFGESVWNFSVQFGEAFQQAINFVGSLFEAFWALLHGDVDGFSAAFRNSLNALAEFLGGLFDVPAARVHAAIDGILDRVSAAATAAGRFITGDFSGAAQAASVAINGTQSPAAATSAGLPAPGGGGGGAGKSTQLADNRQLTIQVNSATAANAAATGREVARAVSGVQAEDRTAILAAVQ